MNQNNLILIAIMLPIIMLCLGYIIGGRHERGYWIDHADNGDIYHRGSFYRVTKVASRHRPGQPFTTGEPATDREPRKPTR